MRLKLTLVCGVPGSGKTSIGKQICRALENTIFIDKDTVTRYFLEELLIALGLNKNDRDTETYFNNVRNIEYETIIKHALENIEIGKNVLCAAPFIKEINNKEWISGVRQELDKFDCNLILVWVHVDPDTARNRIIARGADRDIGKLANWDEYLSKVDHVPPKNIDKLIIIDNSSSSETLISSQVEKVINYLLK